jgi:hypothetical protein
MAEKEQAATERPGTWSVPRELFCAVIGCTAVYSALFATGYWLYGNFLPASVLTGLAAASIVVLFHVWRRVKVD